VRHNSPMARFAAAFVAGLFIAGTILLYFRAIS
jgi:hypothetical protein